MADLAAALGSREALHLGPVPLPMWLPLVEAGIAHGVLLGIDRPTPVVGTSAVGGGIREIAVVGGLHGGPSTTLYPSGTLTIGRSPDADLVLADAEVSRRHARVVIAADGHHTRLEDAGSRNGVRWRGWLLEGAATMVAGDVAGVGETVIGLRDAVSEDAVVEDVPGSGVRVFLRPTRAAGATAGDQDAAGATPVGAERARSLRDRDPDPTRVVALACAPSARLWERRPADDDFLRLRLGLCDRPAGRQAGVHSPPCTEPVPESVRLGEVGALGVSAPRGALLAVARALVAQAAVLQAPEDLVIAVITGQDGGAAWEWAGWLPHTRPPSADFDCARLVATDAEQARSRLAELRGVVHQRVARRHGSLRAGGQSVLVVVDGVRRLRGLPGLTEVLTDGPPVGVHSLCLAEPGEALPVECPATVVATDPAGRRGRLRRPGTHPVDDLLLDGLTPEHATRLALALAPVLLPGDRPAVEDPAERLAVRRRLFTELGRPSRRRAADPDRTDSIVTAVRPGSTT
ncbi:FHA domain-containing protein [Saccharothrix sp. Mg75]|uniref:FHA domain-containing protein n=1 Tax=Saccharothrix sp. Mg75 TaxID=3445357 RepID=UPI003EEA373B